MNKQEASNGPIALRSAPGFYRFKLGSHDVVALHDGIVVQDRPAGFVRNVTDEEVGATLESIGLPRDKITVTLTAFVVDTGEKVILFDTGFGERGPPGTGKLVANLAAAGIGCHEVTTVILSHFHPDHISGLSKTDGTLTFPNAGIVVPDVEWTYWMDDALMEAAPEPRKKNFALVRAILNPLAQKVRKVSWGDEIGDGIRAIKASGHSPGHTAFEIASGHSRMMYVGDITNNPLIFARHPDWQAMFDMDPADAIVTRVSLLGKAAEEKLLLAFFHAPFPALGFVVEAGTGYDYAPRLWGQP